MASEARNKNKDKGSGSRASPSQVTRDRFRPWSQHSVCVGITMFSSSMFPPVLNLPSHPVWRCGRLRCMTGRQRREHPLGAAPRPVAAPRS